MCNIVAIVDLLKKYVLTLIPLGSALPVWRFTRQKHQIWRFFMLFGGPKIEVPAKRLFGGFLAIFNDILKESL